MKSKIVGRGRGGAVNVARRGGAYSASSLLAAAAKSEQAKENLLALLSSNRAGFAPTWRGRDAVPPGGLLESVCNSFDCGSNIPLEIPLILVLHLVSGHLLKRGVMVRQSTGVISPRLWSILLADSSSGKTFTLHQILRGLTVPDPEIAGLSGAVSAAAFFATLEKCPRGLLIRDEFGQFVARIERDQSMADFKDFLLRLYDGVPLSWTTKKDGIHVIENPQVAILGLTQHATWPDKVSPESMLDGFCARYSILIARPDPSRNWRDFPVWSIQTKGWAEAWKKCQDAIQEYYETTADAEEYFCSQFRLLAGNTELPEPFFRRVLFSAHRLACIYHVLAADASPLLTTTDYAWALRLLRHHLNDSVEVIGAQNLSEIERLIQAAEVLRERCRERGQPFNERSLYKNFRALNPQTAAVILRLLNERKSYDHNY